MDQDLLAPPYNVQNLPASLSRRLQKRFYPHVTPKQRPQKRGIPGDISIREDTTLRSDEFADAGGGDRATNELGKERRCPWCPNTFGKQNDLKRHVKSYCCGSKFWVCRNPVCRHSASQKQHATDHRDRSGNFECKQRGWTVIELQCERRHFGCFYCAAYFDDLDKFLDHLGQACRPDKVRGKGHRGHQIRALLEQPELKPYVEAFGLELRGYADAYKGLWWKYSHEQLFRIVEQLEYGLKSKVDRQNPGIPYDELETFLRNLIQPSDKSVWGKDLVDDLQSKSRPRDYTAKPLPPLPLSLPNPADPSHDTIDPNAPYDLPRINEMADSPAFAGERQASRRRNEFHRQDRQHHQLSGTDPVMQFASCGYTTDTERSVEPFDPDPYLWGSLMVNEDCKMVTEGSWDPRGDFDNHVSATDPYDFMQDLICVSPVDPSSQTAIWGGLPNTPQDRIG